ncbi:ABC transporter substrate-binding protein [Streptomyces cadmiisoli]|uniref:ABC transporter substrate-binding protein n=1 Tax=Streptomyces cadmiisoli TaxID=2184053 RepID=UPI0013A6F189|nr:ABC transporter substrate-binding protein [Streptomyces cadmiisoli]
MNNAKIGCAVIGGYVLGRRKKAKVALGLALGLAARRINTGDLAKSLSPVLGNLGRQVGTELTGASKAAATSLLSAKAEHLADSLHERTLGLQAGPDKPGKKEPRAEREDEERGDEERDDARSEDREEEDREEEPRETARKTAHGSRSQSKPSAGARRPAGSARAAAGTSRSHRSEPARRSDDG